MKPAPGKALNRWTLWVSLAAIVGMIAFPVPGYASDADFREGVKAFEEGRYEDAEKLFTEVLKANPSSEEALSYRNEAGDRFFVEVLAKGGKLATLARRLLKRAEVAKLKDRQNEEKMREMFNTMLNTESYIEQYTMVEKLVAQHGHYVVPLAVDVLGDRREQEKRVRVIAFLKRLGPEGILAVLELLEADNPITQLNAAIALGHIGDRRAVPALKRISETAKDADVKRMASEALAKIGYSGSTVDAYSLLAEAYYKEHPLVMDNPYTDWVVWKWRSGRLTRKMVRRFAWNEQVAEELLYDGLSIAPQDRKLWAALVNVYAMQLNEVEGSLNVMRQMSDRGEDVDSEMMSAVEAEQRRLKKARMLIASAGKEALFDGLRKALEDNNAPVAVTIIEALRDINIDGTTLPASGEISIEPVPSPGGLPGLEDAALKAAEEAKAKKEAAAAAKKEAAAKKASKPAKPANKPAAKPESGPEAAPEEGPEAAPKETPKKRRRPRVSQKPGVEGADLERKGYALKGGVFPQVAGGGASGALDGSPLCAALKFGDRRVRFAAAMALARLNPVADFANSGLVMQNLTEAVQQTGRRVVLVCEPNQNIRNEIVGLCRQIGYETFGVASGNDALIRCKRFPVQDLVIVSSELNKNGAGDEPLEFQFVRDLRQDVRTRAIKVMILAPAARERDMQQLVDAEDTVVGVVTPGIDKIVLRDKIQGVFDNDAARRDEKARADKVAEAAALSIASLKDKQTLFKTEESTEALIRNLTARPDFVRIASMKALAAVGTKAREQALSALVSVFLNKEENATEVRVAAANAIGSLIRGQQVSGETFQALKAALAEENTAIWDAAGHALGKALLTGDQRRQVYEEQRLSEGGASN